LATALTSRRLILLRHAKSSWDDGDLDDVDRPLAERGEHDAPMMAERLLRLSPAPTTILTSPALRAKRTAQLVASVFGGAQDGVKTARALYLAAPDDMLTVIAREPPEPNQLIVVGHNPGITELANQLAADFTIDDMPTAAVVALDFTARNWASLASGAGRLAFYDFPKNRQPAITPR
jgi:phosphohistidine phosphatase